MKRENADLRERIEGLRKRVEELDRAGKRQASPFRGPDPSADAAPKPKKKPGRKEGKGKWCIRQPPERVDEVLPALPECCPDCGKRVEKQRTADQFQIEIPPITPIVRKFEVEIGQCCGCGKRVQGKHALQSSDALGAAAVQIGPNALALAASLNKRFGGSWERIADLFRRVFHLEDALAAANNRTTYFHYNGDRNLERIIGPESCVTYFAYEGTGGARLLSVTDPEGFTWRVGYDGGPRVERIADALLPGQAAYYAYDVAAARTTHKDRSGKATYFAYDAFGSPVAVYNPGTPADYYTYDGEGRLVASCDVTGSRALSAGRGRGAGC